MPDLPLDIIETIIDILAGDDPDNLVSVRTFALLCHAVLPICRKRIFASIILNNRDSRGWGKTCSHRTTTSLLQKRLSCIPDITRYVRRMYYFVAPADFNNPAILLAFKRITHLQSLSVCCYQQNSSDFKFSLDDSPPRLALRHLFQLSSLTNLEILGITDFNLKDLVPCVNLEKFEFHHVTTIPAILVNFSNSPIWLCSLSAGFGSRSTVTQMCMATCINGEPFFDFSKLTQLKVWFGKIEDMQAACTLVNQVCGHLVRFEIKTSVAVASLAGVFHALPTSRNTLKHVGIDILFDDHEGDDPLCGLADALEKMGSKDNVLEDISIEVTVEDNSDCDRGDKWGRLDKTFAQSQWPMLRRVSLTITTDFSIRDYPFRKEFSKLSKTQLPWLSTNKSLLFKFELNDTHNPLSD